MSDNYNFDLENHDLSNFPNIIIHEEPKEATSAAAIKVKQGKSLSCGNQVIIHMNDVFGEGKICNFAKNRCRKLINITIEECGIINQRKICYYVYIPELKKKIFIPEEMLSLDNLDVSDIQNMIDQLEDAMKAKKRGRNFSKRSDRLEPDEKYCCPAAGSDPNDHQCEISEIKKKFIPEQKVTLDTPKSSGSQYKIGQMEDAAKAKKRELNLSKRLERLKPIDNDVQYNNDFLPYMNYGMKFMKEKYCCPAAGSDPNDHQCEISEINNFKSYLYECWDYLNLSVTYKDPKSKVIEWSGDKYNECQELKLFKRKYPTKVPVMPKLKHITWCFVCAEHDAANLTCCDKCTASYHTKCAKTMGGVKCPQCAKNKPFTYGSIVWHKLDTYAWWPAMIIPPNLRSSKLKSRPSPYHFPIHYYDTDQYKWALPNETCHFEKGHAKTAETIKNMANVLKDAIKEALEEYNYYLENEMFQVPSVNFDFRYSYKQ